MTEGQFTAKNTHTNAVDQLHSQIIIGKFLPLMHARIQIYSSQHITFTMIEASEYLIQQN